MKNSLIFPKEIHQRAYNKLRMLHNALNLNDLRVPPSNHLEKLQGNIAFELIFVGESVLNGTMEMRIKLK